MRLLRFFFVAAIVVLVTLPWLHTLTVTTSDSRAPIQPDGPPSAAISERTISVTQRIVNTGPQTLTIAAVDGGCGCTDASCLKQTLRPGESSELRVSIAMDMAPPTSISVDHLTGIADVTIPVRVVTETLGSCDIVANTSVDLGARFSTQVLHCADLYVADERVKRKFAFFPQRQFDRAHVSCSARGIQCSVELPEEPGSAASLEIDVDAVELLKTPAFEMPDLYVVEMELHGSQSVFFRLPLRVTLIKPVTTQPKRLISVMQNDSRPLTTLTLTPDRKHVEYIDAQATQLVEGSPFTLLNRQQDAESATLTFHVSDAIKTTQSGELELQVALNADEQQSIKIPYTIVASGSQP